MRNIHTVPTPYKTMDTLGKSRTPFLFIVSYDQSQIVVKPLAKLDDDIFYKLESWRNYPVQKRTKDFHFSKSPEDFKTYKKP